LRDESQSLFGAICGAGVLSSIRSLTFRTVAVSASICFCCCAAVLVESQPGEESYREDLPRPDSDSV